MTVANIETGRPDDIAREPQTKAEGPDGALPAAAAGPEALTDTPSQPDRACYFILGMHRSGTSSVAGTLVRLGIAAPAHLLGANEGNETGHWESQPLIAFHDELLASAGSRWDDWRALNPGWYDTPVAAQFKERANHLLDDEFGHASLFVFKDPRNCRLARFWLEIFAERGIAPKIVLPIRSPLEVARSHHARDGFPLRKGLLLWLRHTLDAEAASRDLQRAVIEWDDFLADWQSSVSTLERLLGAFPANTDLAAAEIEHFLRDDLKHQRVPQDEFIHNPVVHVWVEQAYAAMRALAVNPEAGDARATLDSIEAHFDQASMLFGGVLADIETSLADVERRLGDSDRLLGEALAQLEAASRDSDAKGAEVSRLATEMTRDYAAEQELARLTAAVEHADERCRVISGERDAKEEEVVRLLQAMTDQEIQIKQARLHTEAVEKMYQDSLSWKLTAPLRKVLSMFKG